MLPLAVLRPRWRAACLGNVAERSAFRKYNYRIDLLAKRINRAFQISPLQVIQSRLEWVATAQRGPVPAGLAPAYEGAYADRKRQRSLRIMKYVE